MTVKSEATYPRDPNGLLNSLLDDSLTLQGPPLPGILGKNKSLAFPKTGHERRDEKGRRERQIGKLHFVLDY